MSAAVLDLLRERCVVARQAIKRGKPKAALNALAELEAMLEAERLSGEEQLCRLHPGLHRVDRRVAGLTYLACGCHYADGYRGEGTA